jgi:hypothetical protein
VLADVHVRVARTRGVAVWYWTSIQSCPTSSRSTVAACVVPAATARWSTATARVGCAPRACTGALGAAWCSPIRARGARVGRTVPWCRPSHHLLLAHTVRRRGRIAEGRRRSRQVPPTCEPTAQCPDSRKVGRSAEAVRFRITGHEEQRVRSSWPRCATAPLAL